MAIAWSRISSKVIAHPPKPTATCRRRWRNWRGRSGACLPHMVAKRKPERLGRQRREQRGRHRGGELCEDAHGPGDIAVAKMAERQMEDAEMPARHDLDQPPGPQELR